VFEKREHGESGFLPKPLFKKVPMVGTTRILDNVSIRVYTLIYIQSGARMHTAKLFKNGRSQAVRLPKEYALPGDEVYVKRINGVVMLIPKDGDPWGPFVDSLDKFSDDFLSFKRDQGMLERRDTIK
jgi:antitoxin VapB